MRSHRLKIILSLTVLGSAVGFSAYAQEGAGGPELYFYPVKKWETGVAKTPDFGGRECTIQNEFNNGFIIQMNGSSNWVQQLNINFRQDAFEAGQSYDVTLNVPGQTSKTLPGIANTGNILSLNLKGHKQIFKAMRENAVLDFSVDSNNFRFYLTGFSGAAREFERCMAGAEPKPQEAAGEKPGADAFLVNESIALEAEETKTVPVTEVIPDIPEPEIEEFAVEVEAAPPQIDAPQIDEPETKEIAVEVTREPEPVDLIQEDIADIPVIDVQETPSEELQKELEEEIKQEIADKTVIDQEPEQVEPVQDERLQKKIDFFKQAARAQLAEEPGQQIAAVPKSAISGEEFAGVEDESAAEIEPKIVFEEAPAEEIAEQEIPEIIEQEITEEAIEDIAVVDEAAQEEIIFIDEVPAQAPGADLLPLPEKAEIKVNKTQFSGDADFTRIEPAAAADTATLAKLSVLEQEMEVLRAENAALNDELNTALKEGENERLVLASENWNLEQATKRYNEAERQIKRLGQQIQKERAQCSFETQELEALLFDPEVTSEAQLARLASLEQELDDARREIKTLRSQLGSQ